MNNPWKSITLETRVIDGAARRVLIAEDRLGFRTVRYGEPVENANTKEEHENGLHAASAGR